MLDEIIQADIEAHLLHEPLSFPARESYDFQRLQRKQRTSSLSLLPALERVRAATGAGHPTGEAQAKQAKVYPDCTQ